MTSLQRKKESAWSPVKSSSRSSKMKEQTTKDKVTIIRSKKCRISVNPLVPHPAQLKRKISSSTEQEPPAKTEVKISHLRKKKKPTEDDLISNSIPSKGKTTKQAAAAAERKHRLRERSKSKRKQKSSSLSTKLNPGANAQPGGGNIDSDCTIFKTPSNSKLPVKRCLRSFMKSKKEKDLICVDSSHHFVSSSELLDESQASNTCGIQNFMDEDENLPNPIEVTTEEHVASNTLALEQELKRVQELLEAEKCNKEIMTEKQKRSSTERKKIQSNQQELIESELICIICREIIIKASTLPCGHSFCGYCLYKWLKSQKFCPLCRKIYWGTPSKTLMVDNTVMKVMESMDPSVKKRYQEIKEEREKEEGWQQAAKPTRFYYGDGDVDGGDDDDDFEIPPLSVRVQAAIMAEESHNAAGPSGFQSTSSENAPRNINHHRPCNFCGSNAHLEESCERRYDI